MDELENPFRPGAGTAPPALVGRDELISRLGATAGRAVRGRPGKSVMPVGLRGVGKTVLLDELIRVAEQEGLRVGYLESPETGDLRRLLASTSVSINVDALTGVADSGDLSDDLTDLLVEAGKAAADRNTGIVLAIDEVQYLSSHELGALLSAIHRTVQLDLPVVLVGAGLPQLPGLSGEAKSFAERLFEFPQIWSLADSEARDVLRIPVAEQGVVFPADALELLIERTRGYPYFLQEWGYEVWNIADTTPITRDDVERAAPRVRQKLDESFFLVRMDRVTPAEKAYLHAMATLGPGPHRSGDIAARLGVQVETVAPRRSALIRKGMIYSPAHGDTAFTVPIFDEFLRRSQPAPE